MNISISGLEGIGKVFNEQWPNCQCLLKRFTRDRTLSFRTMIRMPLETSKRRQGSGRGRNISVGSEAEMLLSLRMKHIAY
ncbi:hypothetical protein C6558_26830 [Ensifer sp. NM-2]|nr:hypothetical protein C6558_26830 [Ensifer sp. NM-2]